MPSTAANAKVQRKYKLGNQLHSDYAQSVSRGDLAFQKAVLTFSTHYYRLSLLSYNVFNSIIVTKVCYCGRPTSVINLRST